MRAPYLRAISTAVLPFIAAAYLGCGREESTKEPTKSPKPLVSQPLERRASNIDREDLNPSKIGDDYRAGNFSFTPEEGSRLYLILLERLDRNKLRKESGILYAKNNSPIPVFYDPDLRVFAHDFNFDGRDEKTGYMRPITELRDRSITGTGTVRPTFILNPETYDRGNGKKSVSISLESGGIYGWVDASHFDIRQNPYVRQRMKDELEAHRRDIKLLGSLIGEIKASETLGGLESFIAEQPEFVRKRLDELGIRGYLCQEPSVEDFLNNAQELQKVTRLTSVALRH